MKTTPILSSCVMLLATAIWASGCSGDAQTTATTGGGGTVTTGRHMQVDHVPINNLWLSMIERVGAPLDQLGDSTGKFNLV